MRRESTFFRIVERIRYNSRVKKWLGAKGTVMNLIGKILIMLILVMSVFFMAISVAVYATHHDWEEKANTLSTEVRNLRNENRTLANTIQSSKNSLQLEKAARRESIAVLEQRASQYRERLVTREGAGASLPCLYEEAHVVDRVAPHTK